MAKTNRSIQKLKRRQPHRERKRIIHLACEGKETEPRYFRILNSKSIQINIINDISGTDPLSIYNSALSFFKEKKKEMLKGDEVWIVMDTDFCPDTRREKENILDNISTLCKKDKIGFAVSNPCFEFWLLLHFENKPKISRTVRVQDKCRELLKKHLPDYEKSKFDTSKLYPNIATAICNARALDANEESWPKNHGSTVYRLVERIFPSE